MGHWKDGVMIEEWLFWDNQTYMNQIGLGKEAEEGGETSANKGTQRFDRVNDARPSLPP